MAKELQVDPEEYLSWVNNNDDCDQKLQISTKLKRKAIDHN